MKRYKGTDYVLTYSRAEDNEAQALEVLKNGGIVSAVFADTLPAIYKGFQVIDGDESDDQMINIKRYLSNAGGKGIILGLKAKGDAKKDATGFVITEHLNLI